MLEVNSRPFFPLFIQAMQHALAERPVRLLRCPHAGCRRARKLAAIPAN